MRTRYSIFFATVAAAAASSGLASPVAAAGFVFSTGDPDGKIATASGGTGEPESADDFVLSTATRLTSGSFTGLVVGSTTSTPTISNVGIEIYRVFPLDSAFPPSSNVPTRVNSPSDVEFTSFDAGGGSLSFATTQLSPTFTAANSVQLGIHPVPGEFTGGDGPVAGAEIRFDFNFLAPSTLAAGHYFFVPQVELSDGTFLWLSAPKPIVPPGTPFVVGSTDLQSWIRNEALQPDWLRIGTDITHQGPFNAAFSLVGASVPEPNSWALMMVGFGALGGLLRRRSRRAQIA